VGSSSNAFFRHIHGKDFVVTAKSSFVGGIVGDFTATCTSAANGAYFTDISLKGTPTSVDADGYTLDSTTVIGFDRSFAKEGSAAATSSYCGGLVGRLQPYWVGRKSVSPTNGNTQRTVNSVTCNGYTDNNVSNYVDGIVVVGYSNYIGGLYGASNYLFDSYCYNSYVTSVADTKAMYTYVGGIAGQNGYTLNNSGTKKTWIDVNNHSFIGLCVGYHNGSASINYDKVEDSKINIRKVGTATMDLRNIGGVTGYSTYPVYYCTVVNTSVKAPEYRNVGGITGYLNNAMARCFYYAEPKNGEASPVPDDTKYVIEGRQDVGGLVGYHYISDLTYCYSNANVVANEFYAGGLDGMYRNNYTSTQVSGKVNYAYSSAGLKYNYFAGTVKAKNYAGGLIGRVGLAASGYGKADNQARGGRVATATSTLDKTGSSNEISYTYGNMSFAGKIEATNGTNAYAYAGNVNGFEGRANRNAANLQAYTKDKAEVYSADRTILWENTTIAVNTSNSSTTKSVTLANMKRDIGPDWEKPPVWAKNNSAEATNSNLVAGEPARYVPYMEYGGIYGTNEYESKAKSSGGSTTQLNVRIVSGSDMSNHGPYHAIVSFAAQTSGASGRTWRGNLAHVLFTPDSITKPTQAPYSASADYVNKTLLPHIRINANNNNNLQDYLTSYQVAKEIKLVVPTNVLGARRSRRAMGAVPEIKAPSVYASDVDKINVEFGESALGNAYLMLYYGSSDEPVAKILVDKRTYTFSYDFAKKVRIDYGYADLNRFAEAMNAAGTDYVDEDILDNPGYLISYTLEDVSENTVTPAQGTEGESAGEGTEAEGNKSGLAKVAAAISGALSKGENGGTANDENTAEGQNLSAGEASNVGTDGSQADSAAASGETKYKEEFVYKTRQLARRVMTYDSRYYYITEDGVVTGTGSTASESDEESKYGDASAELISGDFVHIYNGKGLLRSGDIVDLAGGGNVGRVEKTALLDEVTPLEDYTYNNKRIQVFSKYSTIYTDMPFNREMQILKSSNGNSDVLDAEVPNVKDSAVLYFKDNDYYLTVLGTDGIMIDMYQGDNLNAPEDFRSSGIVYMTNNFNTTAPFIVVEYQNGGVVGYNYMTGEYLFNNFKKNEMSLLDYLKVYFDGDKSLLAGASNSYSMNSKVADIAGTPERLAKMVAGTNNGNTIKENNTEGAETAKDEESAKVEADEDNTKKAGKDTALRDSEVVGNEYGSTNSGEDGETHGKTEANDKSGAKEGQPGMVYGLGGTDGSEGRGNGTTSSSKTEGTGSSNTSEDEGPIGRGESFASDTESISGTSTAAGAGGGTKANMAHGNGEGNGTSDSYAFADSTKERNAGSEQISKGTDSSTKSSGLGTGAGNGDNPASGNGTGSGDLSASGMDSANGTAPANGKATGNGSKSASLSNSSKDSAATETELEETKDTELKDETDINAEDKELAGEDTTSKLLDNDASSESEQNKMFIEKHSSKTEDSLDNKDNASNSGDTIKSEKNLKTLYNPATGQYEIVDMDMFLSEPGYQSENARLAIKDFSAVGGYATAEKPDDDDENRRGIALYILASLAVLAGVGSGIYYRKKHKMKV
ncbi:MAG: hypothetical protein K6E68_02730, partial [Lachnospiraceae bacterium]|nr:hypothetical protein [Lachnospiraceae bacterium]